MISFQPGQIWRMPCPFRLEEYSGCDEDGPFTSKSFVPGGRIIATGPDGEMRIEHDGLGEEIRTIVAVLPVPGWPTRVAYTVKWKPPRGAAFGKRRLKVTTASHFRVWTNAGRGWNRGRARVEQPVKEAAE